MELYFLATGEKSKLEFLENRMNTIPMDVPFKMNDKEYLQPIFPMLEEIKLYRYCFPKQYLNHVLKSLDFDKPNRYSMFNTQAVLLRKAMKAKKIPKGQDGTDLMFPTTNVALLPIGIKEDRIMDFPDGTTHEGI